MINLPAGTVVKTGVDAVTIDFKALLRELKEKLFNGYLCITVQGSRGLEDGALVFDSGKIVAAFYEYLKSSKDLSGDQAFVRVLNASLANTGLIDIYQLSNDQVQLILAFNEEAICLPSENDLRKFTFTKFSEQFEIQAVGSADSTDKNALMRKYRLSDVSMGSVAAEEAPSQIEPGEAEPDLLGGLPKLRKKPSEPVQTP